MRRSLLMSATALVFALPLRADELKTADEVIEKYIQAMGGREKIESTKSKRMTGKMNREGMEIPILIEAKRPNMVRTEFTVQGAMGIRAFDGKEGWSVMPFMGKTDPGPMSSDEQKMIERDADFDSSLYDYKKKGNSLELAGVEEYNGKPAYKLKLTTKDGDVEWHFIDKQTFEKIGEKGKAQIFGSEMDYEKIYSDFRDVGGRKMPYASESKSGMGSGIVKFEKIELNVPIDDSRFAMPKAEKKEGQKEEKDK